MKRWYVFFALRSVFLLAVVVNKIEMAVPGNISRSMHRVCLVVYMKIGV